MSKKRRSTILLLIVLITGLSVMLYPAVSDYWNSFHQSKAISGYTDCVTNLEEAEYEKILNDAREYNKNLVSSVNTYKLSENEMDMYESLLNIDGNGMMGYIEIPSIQCSLPIYHGTNDTVLQFAIGHIEWSSLPVGGENTHCVLSGHRGNPSAKLFTNLDKLTEGDIFTVKVLNEVLTYEVDQILTVLPQDSSALQIEKGKDYCTLVTCTPYGVNTHRLLVRGHRIENPEDASVNVSSEAIQIEPLLVVPFISIPILIFLIIFTSVSDRRKR